MRIQLGTAASLTMASLLAFSGAAMAGGERMPNHGSTHHNGGGFTGNVNPSANAAAEANSKSIAASQSGAFANNQNKIVTGGASSSALTGPSQASNGNMALTNTFESSTPMGVAPPVFIAQSGNCSEGAMGGVSAPYVGISFGKTGQDTICLAKEAAQQLINQGIILKDDSMIVGGIAALRAALPKIDQGLRTAIENLLKDCAADVSKKGMRILLTDADFSCKNDGGYELKKAAALEPKTAKPVSTVGQIDPMSP